MNNIETLMVIKMNNRVININLEGLTHEDCLISPDAGGNCINWILGHVIISRDDMRNILGMEKLCDEAFAGIYARGTKPINEKEALKTSDLLKRFNDSQTELEEMVGNTDFSGREKELETLAFLAFHESYHAGQTGLLRRISGKAGAIK